MNFKEKIVEFLRPKKKAQTIEVYLEDGAILKVNFTFLKKQKEAFVIDVFEEGLTLEDALKKVSKSVPITLFVNSDNAISKFSKHQIDFDSVFPNLNKENFWIEEVELFGTTQLIVVPRAELDGVFEAFTHRKIIPYRTICGSSYLNSIMEAENTINLVKSSTSNINGEDEFELENFSTQDYHLKADNEIISSKKMIGYLAGIQSVFKKQSNFTFQDFSTNSFFFQFLAKKAFLTSIVLVFVALIANTLWFNNLNTEFAQLSQELASKTELIRSYEQTQKEIERKKSIINSLSLENPIGLAQISDQIGASLPSSITLSILSVYPKRKVIDKKKEKESPGLSIKVEGDLTNENEFGEWIKRLENINWVGRVSIESFELEEEKRTTNFKLKLDVV